MSETMLLELLTQIKPEFEDSITKNTVLDDMGLTSLDKMILICEIERHIGDQLQLLNLQKMITVGDVLSLLNSGKAEENFE